MANADQIKALIKSHLQNEDERFITIALQLAAHEAQHGHQALARDIRKLVDSQKTNNLKVVSISNELDDLVVFNEVSGASSAFVIRQDLVEKIERIVKEHRQSAKLAKHGLKNRRKILLSGPPGTGKTMTAAVLAEKTGLPFFTVQIDRLITKYMGETSAKLRQIFSLIRDRAGVYLFDEFDAIGTQRGLGNDVGEMRRVLNALLKFIESDESKSLIVAATNSLDALDNALFRRFDDVLHYEKPTLGESISLVKNRIGTFKGKFDINPVAAYALGLSHAEIAQACDDAIKQAILSDRNTVTKKTLIQMLADKKTAYGIDTQDNA